MPDRSASATLGPKEPRTERGRRTLRAILDAAAAEFGERGFHDTGITHITQRAGVALGTFYTYFDSKEEVFRALVRDLSTQVRDRVGPQLLKSDRYFEAERTGRQAFFEFVTEHKEIYRIIDEAEFVDPEDYRRHYSSNADHIRTRLEAAIARGEVRDCDAEVTAWALMGMNVFLGLRFGVWTKDRSPEQLAAAVDSLISDGLRP
ncbi:TetR/AcrR family transcriptional regulator [Sphingomonas sp. ID1715]|uniref:TetR/AcrR family transcriptional regulator n=1 Tax=Sphingomonas sp. ID1715 TaxID=1656898 RepID=UPI0014894DAD|nr:TetR/AcrR family transcriptional regulator [Sphingomonas sp. ID1715]NNM77137.1 TetR/AcrR family transcriptional regulator [Sphingomonas sp. ID1715]